jgi:hypothetical protein
MIVVSVSWPTQCVQRLDHRLGRAVALHLARCQQHFSQRVAPPQHLEHVLQRRTGGRGSQADPARQRRQRALARRVEQPFGIEPSLELLEACVQQAHTSRANHIDI